MSITRRTFLKGTAGAAAAGIGLHAHAGAAPDSRPNILVCIADDWSYGHAGVYGDKTVKTPTFDRLATQGALFTHSFCAAPTCTASRGGILTGQWPHRLEQGANLWSTLPAKFDVYPDLLEQAGYAIGFTGKGWGPGVLGERKRNPAGRPVKGFAEFMRGLEGDQPFYYWFGSQDPHRPYASDLKRKSGLDGKSVSVPAFLPDVPEVRDDLLDYYAEVQRFDANVGEILKVLDASGRAENTLLVITSDNGLPFPHAKANLYDSGTHMPLAIRWPKAIKGGKTIDALVSHVDFAPTFLEAAGVKPPEAMSGRSLIGVLGGGSPAAFDRVFVERERHAQARAGNVGYPCRAIRTREHLYIRNFRPQRWPAGDPDLSFSQGTFSDIDRGPTKEFLLAHRDEARYAGLFQLACAKRPAEELYDVAADPWQMKNLAGDAKFAQVLERMRGELATWMAQTGDPRSKGDTDVFDGYPYMGGR